MVAGKRAETTPTRRPGRPPKDASPKPDAPKTGTSTAALAAGAGVNISDDQESALFFQNKGKLERALAAKKAADKTVQDLGKVIKADHGEHGYAAMKMAIKFATDDDAHKAAQAEIDMKLRVMRWMGMPIGAQGTLFSGTDRRPSDEIAFDRGKLAGMEGKGAREFGYDESHPDWNSAHKGWRVGQDAIFNIQGPKAGLVKGDKPTAPPAAPVGDDADEGDAGDEADGEDADEDSEDESGEDADEADEVQGEADTKAIVH